MSSIFFQKVMMTAVILLMTLTAVNVTAAQETGTVPTQNAFFANPNGDALNAQKEEPYLHPRDCDKFYGKLPRLYLHGNWKLMIVPNTGKKPGRGDFFFDDRGMTEGFTRADYDDTKWDDFYVPQQLRVLKTNKYGLVFNKCNKPGAPEMFHADGYAYQSTRFTIPAGFEKMRAILRLEAADNLPVIFLNGKEIARPVTYVAGGNVDRHAVDITSYLNPGTGNRLVVRTYNHYFDDAWETKNPCYFFNGVWGSAWIEFWPEVRVETMKITPQFPDKASCVIKFNNASAARQGTVKVVVSPWRGIASLAVDDASKSWEQTVPVALTPGTTEMSFTMPLAGIKPWHMDSPYLYSMKIFVDDKLAGWDTFGMRSIARKGRDILINGKPTYFMGVGTGDESDLFNKCGTRATFVRNKNGFLQKLLGYFKTEMGMNHSMRLECQPEIFYQLHDELGLLRADEVLFWTCYPPKKSNNQFTFDYQEDRQAALNNESRLRDYYQRLVQVNFNHPSIMAWGTLSEQSFGPRSNMDLQVNMLHDIDPTRLKFEEGGLFGNRKVSNLKEWNWWKENEGPAGIDFVTTHDRPMDYCFGLSLGDELDELKIWGLMGQNAYKKQGGLPLIASPGLLLDLNTEAFQPFRASDMEKLSAARKELQKKIRKLTTPDGEYDKSALCDFVKLRLGYNFAPFIMRLTGVADYMQGSPRKYQLIAFERQRGGELMRLNREFFQGFNTVYAPDVFPFPTCLEFKSGALPNPEVLQPSYMSKYMKRMQQPVLPLLDWHMKHNLFSGEKVVYKLTVLNDSTRDIAAGEVVARIIPGSAFDNFDQKNTPPEVYKKSFAVSAIPCARRFEQDISLDVPGSLPAGRYTLDLVFTGKDGVIANNSYPINIGGRQETKLTGTPRVALHERRVAIYDGQLPKADQSSVSKILSATGVVFDNLNYTNNLNEYQVLIIAPNSIDEDVKGNREVIQKWIQNGGVLLCLEQDIEGAFPFLPQAELKLAVETGMRVSMKAVRGTTKRYAGFSTAEPVEKKHPIFAGMNEIKDFDTWNGGKGRIYSSVVVPLSESVLLFGGLGGGAMENALSGLNAKAENPSQFGMVAAEVKEGKGVCIFSQVEAVWRDDTDPLARRYLRQLLTYTLSPEAGKYAKPLRNSNSVNAKKTVVK